MDTTLFSRVSIVLIFYNIFEIFSKVCARLSNSSIFLMDYYTTFCVFNKGLEKSA